MQPPVTTYREYAPAPDLAEHVACTWEDVGRAVATRQAIIPDGCADIIAFGDAAPHVACPTATTQWIVPPPAGTLISAIRFRPAAIRAILRCDVDLLVPNLELEAICGRDARPLVEALQCTQSSVERRLALEAWTRDRLAAARSQDSLLLSASAAIARTPWTKVDDIANDLGVSTRQLRRGFVAACGFGPKTLQRVMKFQRALRLASAPVRLGGLAELAAAAGYADQAHMTREFQDLTGSTPARYLPIHNPELGRWLDR